MTVTLSPSSTASAEHEVTAAGWFASRRRILSTIALGTVTWPLIFAGVWLACPVAWTRPTGDRISFAIQLAAAPAFVLLAMITACMRLFDRAGAEDPLAGVESKRFKINQRVITNTLEQGAVFVPLLLALATRVSDAYLAVLPVAVIVWCLGRLVFWAGYHVAPHWRAPGFDWTLLTTMLLAGWLVSTLV